MERQDDAVRVVGYFPNPEKGMRFLTCVGIIALLIIVTFPALYYGMPDQPPESLGALPGIIITGIPAALAPLVELAHTWEPGEPLPDLHGWSFALGLAFALFMFFGFAVLLWRDLTDSRYLMVELRGDVLRIDSGLHHKLMVIPRDECRAVHVARRRSGYDEVLLQHGDKLTPVAIVTGGQRRALLLKTRIDAMITGDMEKDLS